MHPLQQVKTQPAILPGAVVAGGAFTSQVIDTADFDGADEIVFKGVLGATDVALTALAVYESDAKTSATALTNGTKVADASYLPTATDDNGVFAIHVNLKGGARKRYLQLQATAAGGTGKTGEFLTAIAEAVPTSSGSDATNRGLLFADYI